LDIFNHIEQIQKDPSYQSNHETSSSTTTNEIQNSTFPDLQNRSFDSQLSLDFYQADSEGFDSLFGDDFNSLS
jgi:hypothetical protein